MAWTQAASKKRTERACLLLLACMLGSVCAYKPIIMMHGITGSFHDFDDLVQWVDELHPGTVTVQLDVDNKDASVFKPMTEQTADALALVKDIVSGKHPGYNASDFEDGYHVIGHSQGGLLIRAAIQQWDGHKVQNFLSFAGVQQGVYGVDEMVWRFFPGLGVDAVTELLYTKEGQEHFSFAQYWHDSKLPQQYLRDCVYLPVMNNVVPHNNTARYKANFEAIKNVYLFGSPQDGIIIPWYSSQFAFYDKWMDYSPPDLQPLWLNDTIGLRGMYEQGRAHFKVFGDVTHMDWVHDKENFVKNVLQYLD